MTDVASAVRRARKLLRLSQGNNHSADEAATAASIAAKILSRHGLGVDDLPDEDSVVSGNPEYTVFVGKSRAAAKPWKWSLAWTVAIVGRCKPYYVFAKSDRKISGVHVAFIGRREDAIMCCALLENLLDECIRIRKASMPAIGSLYNETTGLRDFAGGVIVDRKFQIRWSGNFYLALTTKLHESMTKSSKASRDRRTKALVRQVAREVDECAKKMGIVYRSMPIRRIDVDGAYSDGVKGAESVKLDPSEKPQGRSKPKALPPGRES